MAQLYTYTINFYDGYGAVSTELFRNSLVLLHRRNDKFYGIIDYYLEGSFDLIGNDFDKAIEAFKSNGYIDVGIVMNGNPLYNTSCYDLCDLDYSQKKCTVKNYLKWPVNSIRNIWTKEFTIPHSGNVDIYQDLTKITDYGYELISLIDFKMLTLGCYETFNPADYWYDTGISIDLDDLRIVEMSYMLTFGGDLIGGGRNSITLLKMFDLLCKMFNITLTIESDQLYFKKAVDIIDNTLDLSAELAYLKVKNYDLNKLYHEYRIKFSDNNLIDSDEDCINTDITFNYAGEILEDNLSDFTTKWSFTDGLSSSGFFIAYVDAGGALIETNGYVSGSLKDNGDLLPANLLNTYYRDFINTDKEYFSVCGNASSTAPTYFRPFIEIPEIKTKIADPSIFYDSVLLELSGTDERIGLVMEQRTELYSNITTFKCYEFKNEIDV